MTITTAAPAPVALSCSECPTGTYRYVAPGIALAACTNPECDHTLNTNLDLDLDGGEVLTTDTDGNVAYWPADTAGGRIGVQPVASRDGQAHLTYFTEGWSFVWTGDAADPIEASDGGYGEPVSALIDVAADDLTTAARVTAEQGIAPVRTFTYLLRALADDFLDAR